MNKYIWQESVRFRDCDGLGHVNNAVYHTFVESCRTHWLDELCDIGVFTAGKSIPIILAHTSMDYLQQMTLAARPKIIAQFTKIGTKSFTHKYEIVDGDRLCARATAVLVWFDFQLQKSVEIPLAVRQRFEALFCDAGGKE